MLKRLKAKLRIMNSICENLRQSVAIPRPRVRPESSAEFKVIQSDSKRFKPKKEKMNPKPTHMYEPKWKNRRVARAHSSTVSHISAFCLPRPARSGRQQIRLNQTQSQSVAVSRSDLEPVSGQTRSN